MVRVNKINDFRPLIDDVADVFEEMPDPDGSEEVSGEPLLIMSITQDDMDAFEEIRSEPGLCMWTGEHICHPDTCGGEMDEPIYGC